MFADVNTSSSAKKYLRCGLKIYNSVFNRKLRAGSLDIPDATFLPGKSDMKMPFNNNIY
jgi:hypothetical protein